MEYRCFNSESVTTTCHRPACQQDTTHHLCRVPPPPPKEPRHLSGHAHAKGQFAIRWDGDEMRERRNSFLVLHYACCVLLIVSVIVRMSVWLPGMVSRSTASGPAWDAMRCVVRFATYSRAFTGMVYVMFRMGWLGFGRMVFFLKKPFVGLLCIRFIDVVGMFDLGTKS